MRRFLIPLLALLPLAAQHYEHGVLYHPHTLYPEGKGYGHNGQSETRLAVTTLGGTALMALPLELQGRRGVCRAVAYREGVQYAYGVLNHPVFDQVGNQYHPATRTSRADALPHVLFRRRVDGPWERIATLPQPVAGWNFRTFLPLAGDRFLVRTLAHPIEIDGKPAPAALIVPDDDGGIRLEAVPGLAGVEDDQASRGAMAKLPGRILLLPRKPGQPMVVLDDRTGERLATLPLTGLPLDLPVALAAARPDGKVLLVLRPKGEEDRLLAFGRRLMKLSRSPQADLLAARFPPLVRSSDDPSPAGPRNTWTLLDPSTGDVTPVAPPQGIPPDAAPWDLQGLHVRPDASLGVNPGRGPFPGARSGWWLKLLPPHPATLFVPAWKRR